MVISDHLTTHLIVQGASPVTPEHSPLAERHAVQASVVLDPLGLALHELVQAFSFLPVKRPGSRLWRDEAVLETLRIFSEFDALAFEHNRALGDHHMPFEDGDLFQVIMHQLIGLNVHRPILVLTLGVNERSASPAKDQQSEEDGLKFQGMNLAE